MIAFISVDLPAPLRPISPTRLPGGIAAVARSRIVRPPRRTVMPLMVSMRAPLAGCAPLMKGRLSGRALPRPSALVPSSTSRWLA